MRYLVLSLLITSQVAFSQEIRIGSSNVNVNRLFNLAVSFNADHSDQFVSPYNYYPSKAIESQKPFVSPMKTLTPNDFSFNNSPLSMNLSPEAIQLGRTMTQSLNIGGIKANARYVFDVNNNLIDHELSFRIGKKKKKKR